MAIDRSRLAWLSVGCLLLGLAASAPASAFTGEYIRGTCMSGEKEGEALCVGYAAGLAQSLMLSNKFDSPMGNFCEGDFQPKDAAKLVLEFMDSHPGRESEDAAGLMMGALLDRFPCP